MVLCQCMIVLCKAIFFFFQFLSFLLYSAAGFVLSQPRTARLNKKITQVLRTGSGKYCSQLRKQKKISQG